MIKYSDIPLTCGHLRMEMEKMAKEKRTVLEKIIDPIKEERRRQEREKEIKR